MRDKLVIDDEKSGCCDVCANFGECAFGCRPAMERRVYKSRKFVADCDYKLEFKFCRCRGDFKLLSAEEFIGQGAVSDDTKARIAKVLGITEEELVVGML